MAKYNYDGCINFVADVLGVKQTDLSSIDKTEILSTVEEVFKALQITEQIAVSKNYDIMPKYKDSSLSQGKIKSIVPEIIRRCRKKLSPIFQTLVAKVDGLTL